jgi:hypothetical protein
MVVMMNTIFIGLVVLVWIPLLLPLFIYKLIKERIKYKRDLNKNRYAFVFKMNHNVYYHEILGVEKRRTIIGEHYDGREAEILLIEEDDWNSRVMYWAKDRRSEIMSKLLSDPDLTSHYIYIS